MNKLIVLDVGSSNKLQKFSSELNKNSHFFLIEARSNATKSLDYEVKDSHINIFNNCISDFIGENEIFITKVEEASSLYKPNDIVNSLWRKDDSLKLKEKKKIYSITLEKFLKDNSIDTVDLLNITAQASELKILRGLNEKIKNVSVILCQTEFIEIYEKQPLFSDILNYLTQKDFEFLGFKEYLKIKDKIINGKVVFINKKISKKNKLVNAAKILCYLDFYESARWFIIKNSLSEEEKNEIFKIQYNKLNLIQKAAINIGFCLKNFFSKNKYLKFFKTLIIKIFKILPGSKLVLNIFSLRN